MLDTCNRVRYDTGITNTQTARKGEVMNRTARIALTGTAALALVGVGAGAATYLNAPDAPEQTVTVLETPRETATDENAPAPAPTPTDLPAPRVQAPDAPVPVPERTFDPREKDLGLRPPPMAPDGSSFTTDDPSLVFPDEENLPCQGGRELCG